MVGCVKLVTATRTWGTPAEGTGKFIGLYEELYNSNVRKRSEPIGISVHNEAINRHKRNELDGSLVDELEPFGDASGSQNDRSYKNPRLRPQLKRRMSYREQLLSRKSISVHTVRMVWPRLGSLWQV